MRRFLTLFKIEGKLMLRSIDSIFFGVLMPIVIALLIGMIGGNKPAFEGATYSYIEASFGALITIGICATAFMSVPLGIADYRDKKILKHYFVTPVSPGMLLFVQVMLCVVTAVFSSISVFIAMSCFFGYQLKGSWIGFIGSYLLVAAAMYGMGMLMASLCRTVKAINLVCTIVYFPMLFLSGATIPFEVFPKTLQNVVGVLPLTQGIKLLKGYSLGIPPEELIVPVITLVVIAVICIVVSVKEFRWE